MERATYFFLAKRISVLHFTSKAGSSHSLRSFSLPLSYLFFIRVNVPPQTKRTSSADIVYAFPNFSVSYYVRLLLCFPGTGCGHEGQVRAPCSMRWIPLRYLYGLKNLDICPRACFVLVGTSSGGVDSFERAIGASYEDRTG